jgi:hypothetical protein
MLIATCEFSSTFYQISDFHPKDSILRSNVSYSHELPDE